MQSSGGKEKEGGLWATNVLLCLGEVFGVATKVQDILVRVYGGVAYDRYRR